MTLEQFLIVFSVLLLGTIGYFLYIFFVPIEYGGGKIPKSWISKD